MFCIETARFFDFLVSLFPDHIQNGHDNKVGPFLPLFKLVRIVDSKSPLLLCFACSLWTEKKTCPKVHLYSLKAMKGAMHGSMHQRTGHKSKEAEQQGQL